MVKRRTGLFSSLESFCEIRDRHLKSASDLPLTALRRPATSDSSRAAMRDASYSCRCHVPESHPRKTRPDWVLRTGAQYRKSSPPNEVFHRPDACSRAPCYCGAAQSRKLNKGTELPSQPFIDQPVLISDVCLARRRCETKMQRIVPIMGKSSYPSQPSICQTYAADTQLTPSLSGLTPGGETEQPFSAFIDQTSAADARHRGMGRMAPTKLPFIGRRQLALDR